MLFYVMLMLFHGYILLMVMWFDVILMLCYVAMLCCYVLLMVMLFLGYVMFDGYVDIVSWLCFLWLCGFLVMLFDGYVVMLMVIWFDVMLY